MARFIVRFFEGDQEWYVWWSTIVDAPVSYGVPLEELKSLIKEEYGNNGVQESLRDLERRDIQGDPYKGIKLNRAGLNETLLTRDQIIEHYCKRIGDKPPLGYPYCFNGDDDPLNHKRRLWEYFMGEKTLEQLVLEAKAEGLLNEC